MVTSPGRVLGKFWRSWPASAVWALGTIVGINLLMSGFTRLMDSRALRAS